MKNQRNTTLLAVAFGMVFLCTASLISFFGYQTGRDLGQRGGTILDSLFTAGGTPQPGDEDEALQPESPDFARPTAIPWDGATRVTMLIMGLDYRDATSSSDASRSDTMILLTVDPVTKTGGILSVPRDLWAYIPGFKPYKINTAYYFGELYNLPGGGPALAMETVEQTIGVEIDYYAVIDFAAFENFIDLIGGVKIDVPEPILLDPLGPKPPRTVPAGTHVLPGYLALAYARNRSQGDGDFARAERQQQVILGIRDRILSPATFDHLITNASSIYNELKSGINTNLSLDDAVKLAFLAVQVEDDDIRQGVIDERYVTFGRSPDDLAILIPVPDKIRQLRDEIFTGETVFSPLTPGSHLEQAVAEGAPIVVLNGSGVTGLDARTAEYLNSLGAQATAGGPASQSYASSGVTDYTGNPFTVAWLAELLRINQNQIFHEFDPNAANSVVLVVGNDWANNNPMP